MARKWGNNAGLEVLEYFLKQQVDREKLPDALIEAFIEHQTATFALHLEMILLPNKKRSSE